MKARLFIVNNDTIKKTLKNMEVAAFVPEPNGKKLWNKTLLDIACDLMQVAIGDYIFLWESGSENIYGVYRAVSKPFYKKDGDINTPFRIKIAEAYSFEKPINEYNIINNPHIKNKLWNIIGKKVAGKSRASSPITGEELQFLIQSLIAVNDNHYSYNPKFEEIKVENELQFDFIKQYSNDVPKSLSKYVYQPLCVLNGTEVQYEKALEGILNLYFRDNNKEILNQLSIDIDKVVWYANYLPYGLERSEIDYLIMESIDGVNISKINVIEFMSGIIDSDHIKRCLQYSKWIVNSLTNDNNIVRPILICGSKSISSSKGFENEEIKNAIKSFPRDNGFQSFDIYTYECSKDGIIFTKKDWESDE